MRVATVLVAGDRGIERVLFLPLASGLLVLTRRDSISPHLTVLSEPVSQ
jgi:hypothetical protein